MAGAGGSGKCNGSRLPCLNLALYYFLIPHNITRPLKKNAEKIRKIRRHTHHLRSAHGFFGGKKHQLLFSDETCPMHPMTIGAMDAIHQECNIP